MVLVGLGVGVREYLISVIKKGVNACECFHLYFVLISLPFSRIDSVFSTIEIGVSAYNPDSFRDCPVKLLLAHHFDVG